MVNGSHQDLSRDDVWTKILVQIKLGTYSAVIMGPPCSTFSRARERPPGPRPLRSADQPYGLPREELTDSEHKELKLGNFYMLAAASAFRAAMTAGATAVFENPEPVAGYASVFMFTELQALASDPQVSVINFDQCRFGAETSKPTRLLVHGCDLTDAQGLRCNHQHKCWAWADTQGRPRRSWGPHPPLAGRRRKNGDFATKAAAAYPSDLNRRLVNACVQAETPDRGRVSQRPSANPQGVP